jgi:hypothetical protein
LIALLIFKYALFIVLFLQSYSTAARAAALQPTWCKLQPAQFQYLQEHVGESAPENVIMLLRNRKDSASLVPWRTEGDGAMQSGELGAPLAAGSSSQAATTAAAAAATTVTTATAKEAVGMTGGSSSLVKMPEAAAEVAAASNAGRISRTVIKAGVAGSAAMESVTAAAGGAHAGEALSKEGALNARAATLEGGTPAGARNAAHAQAAPRPRTGAIAAVTPDQTQALKEQGRKDYKGKSSVGAGGRGTGSLGALKSGNEKHQVYGQTPERQMSRQEQQQQQGHDQQEQ